MNRCDEFSINLSSYIDGELYEVEKKNMEIHLQECDTCTRELEILKQIVSTCSELNEELPDGFETSLHNRLVEAQDEMKGKAVKTGKIRMITQIAAGLVLVITLGLFIRSGLFSTNMKMADTGRAESIQSAPAPEAGEPDDGENNMMMSGGAAYSSTAKQEMDQSVTEIDPEVPAVSSEENHVVLFTEDSTTEETLRMTDKVEGQDTLIRVTTEDIHKTLESILAIETTLKKADTSNQDYLRTTVDNYDGNTTRAEPIEIKLYYPNDEMWQEFLQRMQSFFPDLQVESIPATEDQEYIRIIIVTE